MPARAGLATISWCMALAGCYQPSFPACLVRCSDDGSCPSGASCLEDGLCHGGEEPASCTTSDGAPPDSAADALLLDAGPCGTRGNDTPATPLAIGAGATCVDFTGGGGVFEASCATSHGRELFFQLDLPSAQVVYADSFGSSGPTSLSTWPGPCSPRPAAPECFPDGTCGQPGAVAAARLGPGPACLVVEEAGPPVDGGFAALNVVPSGAEGIRAVPGMNLIESCSQTADFPPGACAGAGPEARWFVPTCPDGISVSVTTTCSPSGRAANLLARLTVAHDSPDLGCFTGTCGTNPPAMGLGGGARGLVWFIVDGPTAGDCGPTTLSLTIN